MGNVLSNLGDTERKADTIVKFYQTIPKDDPPSDLVSIEFKSLLSNWKRQILDTSKFNTTISDYMPFWFKKNNVFQWDKIDSSDNLTIEDEKITIRKNISKDSSDLAKGIEGLHKGYHVYQIYWPRKTRGKGYSIIGLSTDSAVKKTSTIIPLCGVDDNSIGWDLNSKKVFFRGNVIRTFPEDFSLDIVPDYFKMIVDFKRGTLSFGTNTQNYGICFTGITNLFATQNRNLFLTVCLTNKEESVSIMKLPYLLSADGHFHDFEEFTSYLVKSLTMIEITKCYAYCQNVLEELLSFLDECFKDSVLFETVLYIIIRSKFVDVVLQMLLFIQAHLENDEIYPCYKMISNFISSCSARNARFARLFYNGQFCGLINSILEEAYKIKNEVSPKIILYTLKLIKKGCETSEIRNIFRQVKINIEKYIIDENLPFEIKIVALIIRTLMQEETSKLDERCFSIIKKNFDKKSSLEYVLEILKHGAINDAKIIFDPCTMDFLIKKLENFHTIQSLTLQENLLTCLSAVFSMVITNMQRKSGTFEFFKLDKFLMGFRYVTAIDCKPLIEICLNKLDEIKRISSKGCILTNFSQQYLKKELLIKQSYIAEEKNQCFCQFCHSERKDKNFYIRGYPAKKYFLPVGWYRLGLRIFPEAQPAFKEWHRAYLGISFNDDVQKIIETGLPDTRGSVMKNSSRKYLVSPSIKYCSHISQSKKYGNQYIKLAFQVLVKPYSYTVQGITENSQVQFDPMFSNSELEWSVENNNSLIIYGLLMKQI